MDVKKPNPKRSREKGDGDHLPSPWQEGLPLRLEVSGSCGNLGIALRPFWDDFEKKSTRGEIHH
jgi:hypothetical protein